MSDSASHTDWTSLLSLGAGLPLCCTASTETSRLQDREELEGLSKALVQAGFSSPGTDPAAWQRLAEIVGIESPGRTPAEIGRAALIWAERVRVQERLRLQVLEGRVSSANSSVQMTNTKLEQERDNTGFALLGNREWENWGLGLDVNRRWHLFHFHRGFGSWQRHNPASLQIPGGLRRQNLLRRSFKPLLKQAKCPDIRFHDLRHTYATLALSSGVPLRVVSDTLGHCRSSVTIDTYAHVLPSQERTAADAMDAAFGDVG